MVVPHFNSLTLITPAGSSLHPVLTPLSDPPHHASLYVLILVILICVHACGFSAWRADPIDPDVDLYELFHAPYTPVPDPTPMMPPVGVQASVLSHDTIKVTWADNSLPKNQKITDNRFYTVRWKTNIPANTKVKVRYSAVPSCADYVCLAAFKMELVSFFTYLSRLSWYLTLLSACTSLAACYYLCQKHNKNTQNK